ncbi:unnamed protein product, partial [Linum tenue]
MILTTIPTIEFILFIHRHRPPPLTTIASIDIIRRGSSPPLQGDQLPLTPVIVISLFLPPGLFYSHSIHPAAMHVRFNCKISLQLS